MQITKEMLDQRIEQLSQKATSLQAELNATLGAMQDSQFWLAQLAQESAKEEAPPAKESKPF